MPKEQFKFHTGFRVRWMECDAQGIAFNGAYLTYLEVAQAEYYRNLGIPIYHIPRSGYFDLAVVKTTIEFKAPARVDQLVEAYIGVSRIGHRSLTMQLELYPDGGERLLTAIEAVYAGFDAASGTSRPVPDAFRQVLEHFEQTGQPLPLAQFPDLARACAVDENR